jgi:hypothetical protein
MFDIPLEVLLSWPLPSDHPERRGPEIWIFSAIFVFLTTICVALRLYTRVVIRKWIGLDDCLIIVAYVRYLNAELYKADSSSRRVL